MDDTSTFWPFLLMSFGMGCAVTVLLHIFAEDKANRRRKAMEDNSPQLPVLDEFMGMSNGRTPSPQLKHPYTYQADGPKMFSGPLSYVRDGFHPAVGQILDLEEKAFVGVFERHHKSRWSIRGTLLQGDGCTWLSRFVASNADPDMGLVWGTYDKIVYSETEGAFLDFLAHHPGIGWDGPPTEGIDIKSL